MRLYSLRRTLYDLTNISNTTRILAWIPKIQFSQQPRKVQKNQRHFWKARFMHYEPMYSFEYHGILFFKDFWG